MVRSMEKYLVCMCKHKPLMKWVGRGGIYGVDEGVHLVLNVQTRGSFDIKWVRSLDKKGVSTWGELWDIMRGKCGTWKATKTKFELRRMGKVIIMGIISTCTQGEEYCLQNQGQYQIKEWRCGHAWLVNVPKV